MACLQAVYDAGQDTTLLRPLLWQLSVLLLHDYQAGIPWQRRHTNPVAEHIPGHGLSFIRFQVSCLRHINIFTPRITELNYHSSICWCC